MRTTIHQTLTSEAATVLRNAVGLARRRGHAQATPLHVAATLLTSDTSLLRRACLQSHGGVSPLQWRALEVCFNVALNRLPAAVHHGQPSLSNALVAALKRAQAHQRRGCIEQQQTQPLLGVKVEMEQLVISILDDPSVSRVMREAGFYTTHVKNSVEDSFGSSNPASDLSSLIRFSNTEDTGDRRMQLQWSTESQDQHTKQLDLYSLRPLKPQSEAAESFSKDMKSLLEALAFQKRKNAVIVGEEAVYTQSIVRELMARIQSGNVPDVLKTVQFITPELFSWVLLNKDDVQRKLAELNRMISSCCKGGVIVYVGDLRWMITTAHDYNSSTYYSYSPVQHVIVEMGRMLGFYGDKLGLVGTATHSMYMQCKIRQPSLESQWKLQLFIVSAGGLDLSLHTSALKEDEKMDSGQVCMSNALEFAKLKASTSNDGMEKLNCSPDYSGSRLLHQTNSIGTVSTNMHETSNILPLWLRQYKKCQTVSSDAGFPEAFRSSEMVEDLRKKCDQNFGHIYEHQSQTPLQQQQDIHFSCIANLGGKGMLEDSKLQQYSSIDVGIQNSAIARKISWNCPVLRSSSPRSSEHSSKKLLAEESTFESGENRSRLEVETTLTLGRSSSDDHDNHRTPNKRNRPNADQLWSQRAASFTESVSPSDGNDNF